MKLTIEGFIRVILTVFLYSLCTIITILISQQYRNKSIAYMAYFLVLCIPVSAIASHFIKSLRTINKYIYFLVLVLTIILNITAIKQHSPIDRDMKRVAKPYEYMYEFFVDYYDDRDIGFNGLRNFGISVVSNFVNGKTIYSNKTLLKENNVAYTLLGRKWSNANYLEKDLLRISDDGGKVLNKKYPFQKFSCTTKDGGSFGLNLLISNELKKSSSVYVLLGNRDVWFIPETVYEEMGNYLTKEGPSVMDWIFRFRDVDEITADFNKNILKDCTDGISHLGFRQTLYLGTLWLIGILTLWKVKGFIRPSIVCAMGLFTGTIMFVINIIILGITGIPINIITITLCIGIMVYITWIVCKKLHIGLEQGYGKSRVMAAETIIVAAVMMSAIIYFSRHSYVFLTGDSIWNTFWGNYINQRNSLGDELYRLSSYGFFTSLINVGSQLAGIPIFYAFQPVMTVTGTLLIFLFFREVYSFKGTTIFALLITLNIITLPMYAVSSIWIINNLDIGFFMFLSAILLILYNQTGKKAYICVEFIFITAVSFIRIEGIVFIITFIVCMETYVKNKRLMRWLSSYICIISLIEYLWFITFSSTDGLFWTAFKGGAMNLLLVCYVCYLWLETPFKNFIRKIFKNDSNFMSACLCLALPAACLLEQEFAVNNAKALSQSVFTLGYYGLYIFILLISVIFVLIYFKHLNGESICIARIILCFFFTLFILLLFRSGSPLHSSYGDSACRMVLHIMPMGGIVLMELANWTINDARSDKDVWSVGLFNKR